MGLLLEAGSLSSSIGEGSAAALDDGDGCFGVATASLGLLRNDFNGGEE